MNELSMDVNTSLAHILTVNGAISTELKNLSVTLDSGTLDVDTIHTVRDVAAVLQSSVVSVGASGE